MLTWKLYVIPYKKVSTFLCWSLLLQACQKTFLKNQSLCMLAFRGEFSSPQFLVKTFLFACAWFINLTEGFSNCSSVVSGFTFCTSWCTLIKNIEIPTPQKQHLLLLFVLTGTNCLQAGGPQPCDV